MASVPTPGNLPFKAKKCLCPRVSPGGGGGGWGAWVHLELHEVMTEADKVSFLRNFKMERLQLLDILAKKEKIENEFCSVFEGF